MEEARGYWCHMCNQMVDPILEVETLKCPICQSGFVEEVDAATPTATAASHHQLHHPSDFEGGGLDSEQSLSLWAPILLGMINNPLHRHRFRRLEFADDEDFVDNYRQEGESTLDQELESIIRRRRRSSATILQLLQGIRAGMLSEPDNNVESDIRDRDRSTTRDRERVILINPFNQTIIVQNSYGSDDSSGNQNQHPVGSLGDYYIGPGLDLLLQHLADNDPNRYGTPPAQKEAVEAMPTVKIGENLQCSVCLDDFQIGAVAKEMPCKHRFHNDCILPWLELHSSCPVCRYQLPTDESKLDSEALRGSFSSNHNSGEINNGNYSGGEEGDVEGGNGNGRRFSVPLPWPFSNLFSSSGSQTASANSSSTSSSSGSSATSATRTDEN